MSLRPTDKTTSLLCQEKASHLKKQVVTDKAIEKINVTPFCSGKQADLALLKTNHTLFMSA